MTLIREERFHCAIKLINLCNSVALFMIAKFNCLILKSFLNVSDINIFCFIIFFGLVFVYLNEWESKKLLILDMKKEKLQFKFTSMCLLFYTDYDYDYDYELDFNTYFITWKTFFNNYAVRRRKTRLRSTCEFANPPRRFCVLNRVVTLIGATKM